MIPFNKLKPKAFVVFDSTPYSIIDLAAAANMSGFIIYAYKGREYLNFRVNRLQTEGDKKKGYKTVARFLFGQVTIPLFGRRHSKVVDIMKEAGFVPKQCHNKAFYITGDETRFVLGLARNNMPLFEIDIVREGKE